MNGLCINCGQTLTGKQRKYCSDRCRKQHSRKADNQGRELGGNGDPLGFFDQLSDILSDLDNNDRRDFVQNIGEIAGYQDVWVKRVLAQPKLFPPNALKIHKKTEAIFRLITDYAMTVN